jgi:hypothetical protein
MMTAEAGEAERAQWIANLDLRTLWHSARSVIARNDSERPELEVV